VACREDLHPKPSNPALSSNLWILTRRTIRGHGVGMGRETTSKCVSLFTGEGPNAKLCSENLKGSAEDNHHFFGMLRNMRGPHELLALHECEPLAKM